MIPWRANRSLEWISPNCSTLQFAQLSNLRNSQICSTLQDFLSSPTCTALQFAQLSNSLKTPIPQWSLNDFSMVPRGSLNDPSMISQWSLADPSMIPQWYLNGPSRIPQWSLTDLKGGVFLIDTSPHWFEKPPLRQSTTLFLFCKTPGEGLFISFGITRTTQTSRVWESLRTTKAWSWTNAESLPEQMLLTSCDSAELEFSGACVENEPIYNVWF